MSLIQGHKTSSNAPTALVYITLGALMSVWSGVWFVYQNNSEGGSRGVTYICAGLLMTGLAFLAIGFTIGRLAHKAQVAEIDQEAAKAQAIQQNPAMAHKV